MSNTATLARNAMLDAMNTYAGNGAKAVGYSGTVPADANTTPAGSVLFTVTLAPSGLPFTTASAGANTLNGGPYSATASGSGTLTFVRLFKADGTTAVGDYTAGTSGTEFIISNAVISAGNTEQITSFGNTFPA